MFGGVGDLSRVERLAAWGICGLVQCKLLIHLGVPHEAAGARGLCVECDEVQCPDHRGLGVRHPDGQVFLLEAICPKAETQNPNLQVLSVGLCLIRMTKRTTNDLWALLRRHARPTSKS